MQMKMGTTPSVEKAYVDTEVSDVIIEPRSASG